MDAGEAHDQRRHAEMSEPSHATADRAEQAMMLIGPRLYRRYIHLMRVILGVALPIFVTSYALLELIDGADFPAIVLSSFLAALNFGAQLFALVTIVFAIVDRTNRTGTLSGSLVAPAESSPARTDAKPDKSKTLWISISIAVHVAVFVLIIWQEQATPYRLDDGTEVSILDPVLFSGWIWPILAGLAGVIVLDVIRAAGQDWTIRLATIYAIPQALFCLPLAWVFSQQLIFEQRFLTDFNNGWHTPDEFYTAIALILVAWFCWSTLDQFRAARQAQHR